MGSMRRRPMEANFPFRDVKRSADELPTSTRNPADFSLLGRRQPDLAGLHSPMRSFTRTADRSLGRSMGTEGDSGPPVNVEIPPLNPKAYSYSPFDTQGSGVQLGQRLPETIPDYWFTTHDEAQNYGPKAAAKPGSNVLFSKESQWVYYSEEICPTDSGKTRRVAAPPFGDDTAEEAEVPTETVHYAPVYDVPVHMPVQIGEQSYLHRSNSPQQPADRPFKCGECPQSFDRNHDLKRHKRIHIAVQPYHCTFCDKKFARKDALKRHIQVKGCGEAGGYPAGSLGDGAKSESFAKVRPGSYHFPVTPAYGGPRLSIQQHMKIVAEAEAQRLVREGRAAQLPDPQQQYMKRETQIMTETQRKQAWTHAHYYPQRAVQQQQNKQSQRQAMRNVQMNERHTNDSKLTCFDTLTEDRSVNERPILLCAIASKEDFGRHKAPSLALLHHNKEQTHRQFGERHQQAGVLRAAREAGLGGGGMEELPVRDDDRPRSPDDALESDSWLQRPQRRVEQSLPSSQLPYDFSTVEMFDYTDFDSEFYSEWDLASPKPKKVGVVKQLRF